VAYKHDSPVVRNTSQGVFTSTEYSILMRRISSLSVLCLAAGVMTACSLPDEVITTENIPTAGVRFINAVPDTMAVDMRFVDLVESNAHFRISFRASPVTASGTPASTAVQYKNARAGLRHLVVFLDDTLQANAQIKLLDTTYTFVAGKNYTVMMWGTSRLGRAPAVANGMRFDIWEEAVADPSPNAAMRIINATSSAIDAYSYHSDSASLLPAATPTWAAVPAFTASAYVNFAPQATNRTRKFRVVGAGTGIGTGNPFVTCPDASALVGATATADIEPLPGSAVAGTALTGIVFPGSVAGSKAAQFVVTTGAVAQQATAAGYESARSYISDGFCRGQTVTTNADLTNQFSNAANNGTSVIDSVFDGATTTTTPSGTGSNSTRFISATATGYARVFSSGSAGSFTTDGFVAGQSVTASGFTKSGVAGGFLTSAGSNNGVSLITAVTATTMTVTKTEGTQIEAGTVTGTFGVTAGALGAAGGTYTRTAGNWTTDGFYVGQALSASGFAAAVGATPSNNGASTVSAISADGLSMTVSKATGMANEAAAAGRTISVSTGRSIVAFGRMKIVGGRTAEGLGNTNKQLSVTPNPPGIAFVWDRRPPRTACSPLC